MCLWLISHILFMAKTRKEKEQTVAELTAQFSRMKSAVLVDYKGLKVKDAQKVREKSWAEEVDYAVVKKTLIKLALKNAGFENAITDNQLQGNIGLVLGYNDEVATAKFAAGLAKEIDAFKIIGGISEGKFLEVNQVKALASLPGKVELLAKLVGTLQAPISGFVRVMSGNLGGLVRVLNAIKEAKS